MYELRNKMQSDIVKLPHNKQGRGAGPGGVTAEKRRRGQREEGGERKGKGSREWERERREDKDLEERGKEEKRKRWKHSNSRRKGEKEEGGGKEKGALQRHPERDSWNCVQIWSLLHRRKSIWGVGGGGLEGLGGREHRTQVSF